MGLRTVALAQTIVIGDITTRDMVKVEIEDVDGVETVYRTFLEPDSRGLLRLQRDEGRPVVDTLASGALNAWLNLLAGL